MAQRKKPIGEEYQQFRAEWARLAGNVDAKKQLIARYGIGCLETGKRWYMEGDTPPPVKEIKTPQPPPAEPEVISLEPVKIQKFKPLKRLRKDPETQGLLLSDLHDGEITPSYNTEVCKKRITSLAASVVRIANLHRMIRPVDDLVILSLGDLVHGENPYQGAKLESVEMGARSQIYDVALPMLVDFVLSLKQEFKTISVYGIRGNHGRVDRAAPYSTNWDIILGDALGAALSKQQGISVHFEPRTFYQVVTINGFKFFIFHGDQVSCYQGIPWYGLKRKVSEWNVSIEDFNYACCGHWHNPNDLTINRKVRLLMNGALPTDDEFTLERIGTPGCPVQKTFGVHCQKGISWTYDLILDNAFLPIPVKEEAQCPLL